MAPRFSASLAPAAAFVLGCLWLGTCPVPANTAPYRVTGTGSVTDDGHPTHPGEFHSYEFSARVTFDPEPGEAAIVLQFPSADSQKTGRTDRYYVRRGRVFQVDDKGAEILPGSFADIPAAAIAALHPALVRNALRERPECIRRVEGGLVFAWNDELWTMDLDPASPADRVRALRFELASYTYGDQMMEVRYEGWPAETSVASPGRVVMHSLGREVLRIDWQATEAVDSVGIATGDRTRDRQWVALVAEIVPREIAPHLFTIDLASLNMRVFVAEFRDHLMVFEGAWDPRNSDPIAARIREYFRKPVRWYAFSHIHSQYIAGTRSFVHEGATVLVPPATAPLIESMVRQGRRLRPDTLAAHPRPLRMETIQKRRRIEDRVNAAEIHNVESGHTDDYLIVYFPRQKVLLTGDLLFYRPGKPFSDRSQKLWENVRKLGLDVETYVATWPLDGYGTKNVVTRDEVQAASQMAAYPSQWWAAVPKEGAPSWEILPQEAGPGEVILSKRHELGLLSNFAPTPFTFRGRRYASLEGFWQMMLYPENENDPRAKHPGLEWKYTRDQVAQMTSFEAKKAGDLAEENMRTMKIGWVSFEGRRFDYRSSKPGEHYRLIVAATREKVRQNPEVQKVLLATGDLVLKPDHHQEPDAPPEWRYFEILTRIRDELKKKR